MSTSAAPEAATPKAATPKPVTRGYAAYALVVLIVVYIFNFLDRTILSILAEDLKRDLLLTDSELGFLYGTAFAVFYAVFGVPLARLADHWLRGKLIALGLGTWSLMTVLSGTANNLGSLALYRFGVGIGESSASPAAFSLLSDYFSPKVRAIVMSLYSSGIYIGSGIGLVIGGLVVENWNEAYPDLAAAPYGLAGWQVAFMAVGAPGILLAIVVWFLREPQRGFYDPNYQAPDPSEQPAPLKILKNELETIIPPFHLRALYREGGTRALGINMGMLAGIALVAAGLILLSGDLLQWVAIGIGAYATVSWVQALTLRDMPSYRSVFKSKALMLGILGYSCTSFVTYGVGFWAAPFFIRNFGMSETEAGLYLGTASALGGFTGITFGGWLSDKLRSRMAGSRPLTLLIAGPMSMSMVFVIISTESLEVALWANLVLSFFSTVWVGTAPSAASELVPPNMRATAGAVYILINTFIGLALGPYCIGKLSDVLEMSGMDSASALGAAMGSSTFMLLVAFVAACISIRHYKFDEDNRQARADGTLGA